MKPLRPKLCEVHPLRLKNIISIEISYCGSTLLTPQRFCLITPDHFSMIGGFNYLSGGAEENWTLDLLNAIQALPPRVTQQSGKAACAHLLTSARLSFIPTCQKTCGISCCFWCWQAQRAPAPCCCSLDHFEQAWGRRVAGDFSVRSALWAWGRRGALAGRQVWLRRL